MPEIEIARACIRRDRNSATAKTLHQVISALEHDTPLDLGAVYRLDYEHFNLVMGILKGWWLQRYTGVARNGVTPGGSCVERRNGAGTLPAEAAS